MGLEGGDLGGGYLADGGGVRKAVGEQVGDLDYLFGQFGDGVGTRVQDLSIFANCYFYARFSMLLFYYRCTMMFSSIV